MRNGIGLLPKSDHPQPSPDRTSSDEAASEFWHHDMLGAVEAKAMPSLLGRLDARVGRADSRRT
jgi:hypothetical protein